MTYFWVPFCFLGLSDTGLLGWVFVVVVDHVEAGEVSDCV